MTTFILATVGLLVFDALALKYGAESRSGFDERREDRRPNL